MENELILVIDFYSQFNQLITRRIRECNVYAEIVPHNTPLEEIKAKQEDLLVYMLKMQHYVTRVFLN